MRFAVFPAGSRPVCISGDELARDNRAFVQGVAFGYFGYLGRLHRAQLEGDDAQLAATALRTAYHHGLETLFTFIGAAVQAPHAVAAWIERCKTGCLRRFVQAVQDGESLMNELDLDAVTWDSVAAKLLAADFETPEATQRVRRNYAGLWRHFAADFLNETHVQEYNSLKHGLRVQPGGFSLFVGGPATDGGPPPRDGMHSLGSSVYGSRFYDVLPIDPNRKGESHVWYEVVMLNWSAEDTAAALELISYSLQNVCAWLRHWAGEAPSTLPPVVCPEDDAAFELPWAHRTGVHTVRHSTNLTEEHIKRRSEQELLDILRGRRTTGNSAEVGRPPSEETDD